MFDAGRHDVATSAAAGLGDAKSASDIARKKASMGSPALAWAPCAACSQRRAPPPTSVTRKKARKMQIPAGE